MPEKYLTAGGWNTDNIVADSGEISLQQIGGNAVYSSMAVSVWEKDVCTIGNIPANYPGEWLTRMEKAGIDVSGVERKEDKVLYEEWFLYNGDGSREDQIFIRNDRLPSFAVKKERLSRQEKVLLKNMARSEVHDELTYNSFRSKHPIELRQVKQSFLPLKACHLAPRSYAEHLKLADYLSDKTEITTLDPAMYVEKISKDELRRLLRLIDVFMPSQKELTALYPDCNIDEALKKVADHEIKAVVVKLGSSGCRILDNEAGKLYHVSALDVREIVDLTGAGDVFCGSFLAGYSKTGDLVEAAKYGVVTAAARIKLHDPFALLDLNQLNLREKLTEVTVERL